MIPKIRFLFSRLFITAISFLIQVGLIIALVVLTNINEYRPYTFVIYCLLIIFAVLIFFSIINRKDQPEYKIPWIIILCLLPIFGLAVYLLFGRYHLSKTQEKNMRFIHNKCIQYLPKSSIEQMDKNNVLSSYYGVSNYLTNINQYSGSMGDDVTFYKMGELYLQGILEELKKAKQYILIQFFIIKPSKMWDEIHSVLLEKVKSGVEVNVMYDDMGSSTTPIKFAETLNQEGIHTKRFNALKPWKGSKLNNRDHRKIVVIDGKVGFTGGVNVGDEYINLEHPFGESWKDTGIKIVGESVKILIYNFLMMFHLDDKEGSFDVNKYFAFESIKGSSAGFVQPLFDGPRPFYDLQIGKDNYMNLISSAKKSVWIYTPYLIPDHTLLTTIRNAALRGLDVRIITPHIPDKKMVFMVTRSHYEFLYEGGVKIYEYKKGFVHAKEMIIDQETAFIGTINLDYRSLVHHFECGVDLIQHPEVKKLAEDYEITQSECLKIDPNKFYLNIFQRVIISFINIFLPML